MHSLLTIPGIVPAARLERPAAQTVPFGIAAVDRLTGGLPRGALTEICGAASSGRTSLLLSVLAAATRRRELCALVDAGDGFDPQVAATAGLDLDRLLWVRCSGQSPHRGRKMLRHAWFECLEQALKATDLLLQGGGFGLVAMDLADVPADVVRHVPLASWFRFSRAVEHTPTALLAITAQAHAGACASLTLRTEALPAQLADINPGGGGQAQAHESHPVPHSRAAKAGGFSHARLLRGLSVEVRVVRARELKKAPSSASTKFESWAEWA